MKMDPKNAALIIVDMQNDFVHDDGFTNKFSKGGEVQEMPIDLLKKPIPAINRLAECFRKKGKEVIYIYTACEPDYSDVAMPLKTIAKAKEVGALVKGSWGAQMIDELAPREGDHLVRKHSYGGFFQTPLDRILRNLNITDLIVTGVNTNFCVETTVREAVAYGYEVTLVSDATASFDPEGHKATLKVIAAGFGEVMTTEDILEGLLTH
jgi:ureidoacrylate peracid hydrolase